MGFGSGTRSAKRQGQKGEDCWLSRIGLGRGFNEKVLEFLCLFGEDM